MRASAELKRKTQAAGRQPADHLARHLLLAAIDYPDIAIDQVETLALLRLGSLDSLRDAVLDACSSGQSVQTDTLRARLAEAGYAATMKRLDGERGPMQAALGGTEASFKARTQAWTRLAAAYMERSEAQRRRDEIRARLNEEIGRDDSESVRRLVEAWRRETSRSEPS
jgi:DNA primase